MRIVMAVSRDVGWANLKRPLYTPAKVTATFFHHLRHQVNLKRRVKQKRQSRRKRKRHLRSNWMFNQLKSHSRNEKHQKQNRAKKTWTIDLLSLPKFMRERRRVKSQRLNPILNLSRWQSAKLIRKLANQKQHRHLKRMIWEKANWVTDLRLQKSAPKSSSLDLNGRRVPPGSDHFRSLSLYLHIPEFYFSGETRRTFIARPRLIASLNAQSNCTFRSLNKS